MRNLCHLLTLILCVLIKQSRGSLNVAGYLPDYRFYINLNQTALHLTDLYLFSMQLNPDKGEDMLKGCCLGSDQLTKAQQAAAYKMETTGQSLKQWIVLGGGGRSEGFLTLKGPEKYRQFIMALSSLTREYGIEGVDFDHEAMRSREDVMDFFRLVVGLAPALRKLGLSVSIAIHAGFMVPNQVYQAVDRINVMTYDYPFASVDEVKGTMDALIAAGVPSNKLFLGIPAYGRHNQEIGKVMTFAEIVDAAGTHELDEGTVRGVWNEFQYDSPRIVRRKVLLAKQKNLGGVFLWEVGQDKQSRLYPGGILLEMMQKEAAAVDIEGTNEL